MPSMITAFYASLLAVLFVGLALRVIRLRRRERVAVGDGDSPALRRAIRVHANFAEYVPLALLLMAFAEAAGASEWCIHLLGIGLLVGRLLHAFGVSRIDEDIRLRTAAMALTFAVLIGAALQIVVLASPS